MEHDFEKIASISHEVNRRYCQALGDFSQPAWEDAPDWQRDSIISGVMSIASGEITDPGMSHAGWLKQKVQEGWGYGEVKDPEAKTHPCMVQFNDLPTDQRAKDYIFFSLVNELLK